MPTLKRRLRWVLVVPVLAVIGVAGWTESDAWLRAGVQHVSEAGGLTVSEIWVTGRKRAAKADLVQVLRPAMGASILAVDVRTIVSAIEDLGWVADAGVRVQLPGRLVVSLHERIPAAVWQQDGMLHAIDSEGTVLGPVSEHAFPDLMLVVGAGANTRLGEIQQLLNEVPSVWAKLAAAIRVSERRWTLQLTTGVRIHLPEAEPAAALARLVHSSGGLRALDTRIEAIDLRVPGRIAVRMRDEARAALMTEGV